LNADRAPQLKSGVRLLRNLWAIEYSLKPFHTYLHLLECIDIINI